MESNIDCINSLRDDLEIHDTLRGIVRNKERIWIWQELKVDGSVQKKVSYCLLKRVDVIKKICEIIPTKSNEFKFVGNADIYIFVPIRNLAVKLKVLENDVKFISFTLPAKISVMSEEYFEKIELIEKEDETSNLHRRYTPRKAIKDDKLTGLYKIDGSQEILGFHVIGDVSSGGMSFFVDDPAEFEVDQFLKVINVGPREFKNPVQAVVRSVRQVEDEFETIRFKVGVQFLKG